MINNISKYYSCNKNDLGTTLDWNDDKLVFVVREPFLSKMSETIIGYGIITKKP